MACLAHVFEEEGALDQLEAFASLHGPAHYGLEPNAETITLLREDIPVPYPAKIETGAGPVTLFDPGHRLHWRVAVTVFEHPGFPLHWRPARRTRP